jgi:serine/threonine protein kinase
MARKEVELMKTLHHKNIVRFIDQFRQNGVWYIVLEFCGKGDLQQYKQKVGKAVLTQDGFPSTTARCWCGACWRLWWSCTKNGRTSGRSRTAT